LLELTFYFLISVFLLPFSRYGYHLLELTAAYTILFQPSVRAGSAVIFIRRQFEQGAQRTYRERRGLQIT
jgi:hypothetical protein